MTYQPKTTAKMREELSQHMDYMERRYDRKTAKEYFDNLLSDLAACEAALAEEQEKHQWQPIETAPKDGTTFIALLDGKPCVCYYDRYYIETGAGYTGGDGFTEAFSGEEAYRHGELTHWLPIPQPPERSV